MWLIYFLFKYLDKDMRVYFWEHVANERKLWNGMFVGEQISNKLERNLIYLFIFSRSIYWIANVYHA